MGWFKKILIIILLGFVILAGFLLYAGKFKETGRKFLYQDSDANRYFNGNLFNYCGINKFKEQIIKIEPRKNSPSHEANIIMKGDSFFYTGLDSEPLPEYFEKITGQKVFYQAKLGYEITPLKYLERIGYQKGESKIFIYETIEQASIKRAQELESDLSGKNDNSATPDQIIDLGYNLGYFLFDSIDIEYFIRNNFIFKPLDLWFKNKAFIWLGDINSETPIYSDEPRMLFSESEISFNNRQNRFDSINQMADNISQETKLIKDKYNLTLIYLIIPNKFSIYGERAASGQEYDNFIPKLQEALKNKNIKYVDIYGVFNRYRQQHPDKLLYYVGDSHYTPLGKELLTNALAETIADLK